MTELEQVQKQIFEIVEGRSSNFDVVSHEFVNEDIWNITLSSHSTGKLYSVKNDGLEFFDFEEKS